MLNKLTRLSALKVSVFPWFNKPYIAFETSLCSFKTWKMLLSVPFFWILSSVVPSCPTLQRHGQKRTRLPRPSPTPGVYSNSCPLSRWCHPTISSSVVPFSSSLQSFPASGSFPMSQFFKSGGQSIKSFSFSISPSNEYSGLISFRIDWFDLLAVQGTLKSILQHHSSKASILWHSAFFIVQLSHPYMTTGKTIALTRWTFVNKVMSLLSNILSGWSWLFFQGASVF